MGDCFKFCGLLRKPELYDIQLFSAATDKGGLMSDSFSLWIKSPEMDVKSQRWAFSSQGLDLAPIFEDFAPLEF